MRDGYDLQVREYTSGADGPLILLLHGSGWNGLQFTSLSKNLLKYGRILVPDLRGHGAKPGRRGDVDYIGQLEDDLADLIDAERAPAQKVVLLGHSSGGGLAVRMAGGSHGDMLDGAILLAPFLKYNAPTARENSGGWARPLTRRIIGLSMLNAVGIELLNSVSVIEFNMPKAVLDGPLGDLATTQYSYRMNVSYAPRSDYLTDICSLPPFLVVVGEQDEAFLAQQFEPLMSAQTAKGRYHIVPETGHLDIVDSPQALAAIEDYLDGF
nr:alpha/beta hydrolase [Zongyanglinia huanghaiensis]